MKRIILNKQISIAPLAILVIVYLLPVNLLAKNNLPSALVKLTHKGNAILVEKKTQTLFLYSNINQNIELKFKSSCSTGEIFGNKIQSGDKKTPEGVYFLKDEYEDKYLSPIYGKKAFPLDYPNFVDKKKGKNGSAIWIHGTNKTLLPRDSNGCIAMENENILTLADYISLNLTPVIIVEKITTLPKSIIDIQKNDLIKMIDRWAKAIEQGSYHDYLSFFSSDYLPRIKWWTKWSQLRKSIKTQKENFKISIDDIGIYKQNNTFVTLFNFGIEMNGKKKLLGKKQLFIINDQKEYKIIGDLYQNFAMGFKDAKFPIVNAGQELIKGPDQKKIITDTLHAWLKAWSSKDMDKYASFYSQGFVSDGLNKKRWVRRKKNLARKYNFINVQGKDFKIEQDGKECTVVFFQEYESNTFNADGIKTLNLVKKDGSWKIYKENWKKN